MGMVTNMSTTFYMNLSLPTPSVTLGPDWASMLNTALTTLDEHDHTTGKGKKIPFTALSITDDLDLVTNRLVNVLSLKLSNLTAALTSSTDFNSLQSVNNNLYYVNGAGIPVQITNGGTIMGTQSIVTSLGFESVSEDVTILNSDTFVVVSVNTTNAVEVTLPPIGEVSKGRFYLIKDATGNALSKNITITPDGTDTIEGASNLIVNFNYGSFYIASDGISNWIAF